MRRPAGDHGGEGAEPPPPNVVVVHRRPVDGPDPASFDPGQPGVEPGPLDPDRATRTVRRAIDQLVGEIEGGLAERRDEDSS